MALLPAVMQGPRLASRSPFPPPPPRDDEVSVDRALVTKNEGTGLRDGGAGAAVAAGLNDNGAGGGGVGGGMADRALRQMMGGSLADKKVWVEGRGADKKVWVGGRTGVAGSWCMSGKGTRLTLELVQSSR